MRAVGGCSAGGVERRSTWVITVAAILCAGALTAAQVDAGVGASSAAAGLGGVEVRSIGSVADSTVAGTVRIDELWVTSLDVSGANIADALLADLDGDGVREILVTMGRGRELTTVVALEPESGTELWRVVYTSAASALTSDLFASPGEEVMTCFGHRVLVQSGARGKTLAERELPGKGRGIGVVRTTSGELLIVLTVRGDESDDLVALELPGLVERWRRTARHDGSVFGDGLSKLICADVDGDGASEILVVENANILRCVSSAGEDLWSSELGKKSRMHPEGVASNLPVVADLTGDGYNEVAIGCFAGALITLDGETGDELVRMRFGNEYHREVIAKRQLPRFIRNMIAGTGEPIGEMASVDVDGSSGSELVFGCSDGLLYAVAPKWEKRVWELDLGGDVYDAPVPVELAHVGLDGGVVPCLVAWHERRVAVLARGTGEEIVALPDDVGASCVLVCDVNGDGKDDLIVVSASTQNVRALEFRTVVDEGKR
jgi:hypothetical protein